MKCVFVLGDGAATFGQLMGRIRRLPGLSIFCFCDQEAAMEGMANATPDALIVFGKATETFEILLNKVVADIPSLAVIVIGAPELKADFGWPNTILLSPDFNEDDLIHALNIREKEPEEESLLLLETIVKAIPVPVYWKDTSLKFLGCNDAFCKYNKLEDGKVIVGQSDYDLFHPDVASIYQQADLEIMQSGKTSLNYEEEVRERDGSVRVFRKSKIPLKDKNGEIVGVLGIYEEITGQVHARKSLQTEQNYLRVLIDNIPDTIYFKDRKSRFIRINPAQAGILGVAHQNDAIGKSDRDFFDEEHSKKTLLEEEQLMQSGVPTINRLERLRTAEGYRYMLASKIPMYDSLGNCIGLVGISRDVTEENIAKQELHREKELLRILMDNIPDKIFFKDKNFCFIRVNKAHCTAAGHKDPDEIIGKSDFDLKEPEMAREIHLLEKKVIEERTALISNVEKRVKNDGTTRWSSVTKVPFLNEKGNVEGLVGISRDITKFEENRQELVVARERAEEANRAKSMFLANMSHEIRTPMNGVIGMADILKRTKLDPVQREYLDIIMKSGQNLISIINDILDFSKIESGRLDLECAPVSIRNIVEEVADIQVIQANEKGIDLLTYVDPEIPEFVIGDYVRIKQILTNLVNNAVKFTGQGEVYISVDWLRANGKEHELLFKVRDTGIGISEQNQKKLFQSFSQVDSSTTRKFGGTGLGLAICKRLVNLMQGEIAIKSAEGQGTEFSFRLNLNETDDNTRTGANLHNISFSGLTAIVVDDNKTNRLIFREYLESWKVHVYEAISGPEALSLLGEFEQMKRQVDFMLIDFQMADMDGLELGAHIRKLPYFSKTGLILLSSVTDVLRQTDLEESDFNFYLNKPLKLGKLYQGIATVLGKPGKNEPAQDRDLESLKQELQNKHILIVEDNLINMKVAEHALRPCCQNLHLAKNGKEAVELFQSHPCNYILMDIQMPVMNGIDATIRIREIEQLNGVDRPARIIAMTANTMKEDVEFCLSVGMDAFLGKPFKLDDLLEVISQGSSVEK